MTEITQKQRELINRLEEEFAYQVKARKDIEERNAVLVKKNAALEKKNKQLKLLLRETLDKITEWESEDAEENNDD